MRVFRRVMGICVLSDLERLQGGDIEQDTCTESSSRQKDNELGITQETLLSLSGRTQAKVKLAKL